MSLRPNIAWALLAASVLLGGLCAPARAVPIENRSRGSVAGVTLDTTLAAVRLDRLVRGSSGAFAEVAPNVVLAAAAATPFQLDVRPQIAGADSGVRVVRLTVPPGFTNLVVTGVRVAGTQLVSDCPSPTPGGWCVSVSGGTATVTLGAAVVTSLAQLTIDLVADAPAVAGSGAFSVAVAYDSLTTLAAAGDADGDPLDANSLSVSAQVSQGERLAIAQVPDRGEALVGEVVTYEVAIRNTGATDVTQVRIEDRAPPGFKFVSGTARLDGVTLADPPASSPFRFVLGTVPGRVDANGNGVADPGEVGFRRLTYQLVVGASAAPGRAYRSVVVARDACDSCRVSNVTGSAVRVVADPLFDFGTIVGKVFDDRDRDDWQDAGERGIADATVVLDDGSYAVTDAHGRFSFARVRPGHRMLKLDVSRLPAGSEIATEASRIVPVTPGILMRADFGARVETEEARIGTPDRVGFALESQATHLPVEIIGHVDAPSAVVQGTPVELPTAELRLELTTPDDVVRRGRDGQVEPLALVLAVSRPDQVSAWRLNVRDGAGASVRVFDGSGAPPSRLTWDARDGEGRAIEAGRIYQLQLEVDYGDRTHAASAVQLLGVDRSLIVSMRLVAGEC
ncbi:MAG: DUF11 domain-containing protein, partial [Candidatus Eisenbacteria bacterium]|nr:DUF11 domain-containing protein [Candidatus Eisenbacteria bacterium]